MEGVVVGQEGIDPDQDVTGAGRGEEVVVGTAGLEAGLKSTGEEVGQNQGQDTGARKKEPVLTRPTLYSRRYLVIIIFFLKKCTLAYISILHISMHVTNDHTMY